MPSSSAYEVLDEDGEQRHEHGKGHEELSTIQRHDTCREKSVRPDSFEGSGDEKWKENLEMSVRRWRQESSRPTWKRRMSWRGCEVILMMVSGRCWLVSARWKEK